MVTCLGLQQRSLAFSHIILHATFKALLFLSVGIMIHSVYGSQSFRKIGTLVSSSWLVGSSFLISSLSLCGFVFMSGWCTKESLLSALYSSYSAYFVLLSFYFGFFLTLAYSFRLVYYRASVYKSHVARSSYSAISLFRKVPLLVLCLLSVVQGSLLLPVNNLSCEVLSSWVVCFYWLIWFLGGYFGMWFSQGLQGLPSALFPLYSLSSYLAAPTISSTLVFNTETVTLQRAYSNTLYGLRAVSTRYSSLLGVG